MSKLGEFMNRYTLGFLNVVSAYCNWAESQAKSDGDLLVLGLGPVVLLGVGLYALPEWLGKPIAFVLLLPALYVIFMVVRAFVERNGKS